jgi:hypothetical protein
MTDTVKMTVVKPPEWCDWDWKTRNLEHVPVVAIGPRQPKGHGFNTKKPLAAFDVFYDGERIGTVEKFEQTHDRKPRGLRYVTSRTHGIAWAWRPTTRDNRYAYALANRQRNEAVYALALDELEAAARSRTRSPSPRPVTGCSRPQLVDDGLLIERRGLDGLRPTPACVAEVLGPKPDRQLQVSSPPGEDVPFDGACVRANGEALLMSKGPPGTPQVRKTIGADARNPDLPRTEVSMMLQVDHRRKRRVEPVRCACRAVVSAGPLLDRSRPLNQAVGTPPRHRKGRPDAGVLRCSAWKVAAHPLLRDVWVDRGQRPSRRRRVEPGPAFGAALPLHPLLHTTLVDVTGRAGPRREVLASRPNMDRCEAAVLCRMPLLSEFRMLGRERAAWVPRS